MTDVLQSFDPAPVLAEYPDRSTNEIADILGVSTDTIRAWRTGRRRLQAPRADELAIRLGTHPALLWPNEWTR